MADGFRSRARPASYVTVSADIFADGHDVVDAALQYRRDGEQDWQYEPMLTGHERSLGRRNFALRSGEIFLYFAGVGGCVQNVVTRPGEKSGRGAGPGAGFDEPGRQFLATAASARERGGCGQN